MNSTPLVSVGILTYNNFRHNFEAIDSVLKQDTLRIELIISNDCSSDFDETTVFEYISMNKGPNIEKVIINKNEMNLGTVKHANKVVSMMSGEYIFLMAGDDALFDSQVLTKFVSKFEELGSDAYVVTSQCGMYDEDLENLMELYLSEEKIEKIKNFTPMEMFKESANSYTIPATGTCYRKEFYDLIGGYDEEYFIIEDAPTFIKMSRIGIKTHYLDIISIKHRDGGISHGNKSNSNIAYRKYWEDEIRFYRKEVLPYRNLLSKNEYSKASKRYKELRTSYTLKYELPYFSKVKKSIYIIKNSHVIISKILKQSLRILYNISNDRKIIKDSLLFGASTFVILKISDVEQLVGQDVAFAFNSMLAYVGIFAITTGILLVAVKLLSQVLVRVARKMSAFKVI